MAVLLIKMQRQGLVLSVRELLGLLSELPVEPFVELDTKFQVNIINESGASDGWRLE